MPRFIWVCLLVLASGLNCMKDQMLTASPGQEQKFVELSQRRFQAFFDGDKAAYEHLLASDVVFVYSNGRVLDRRRAIAELTPLAKPGTFTFMYKDVQLRDLGNSVVLVYRLVFHGPPEVGDYQGMSSEIWALRNGAWQLLALQGTTIPYPARTPVAVDSTLLDEYVGRYAADPGVYYDISRQGTQLMGQRNGFAKVPWLAESDDSFFVLSDPSASRIFMRDSKGRIAKLLRVEAAGNSVWTKIPPPNSK